MHIPREESLKRVVKDKDGNRVPLVFTYHSSLPPVASIVRGHWQMMKDDSPRLGRCYASPPVIAYKRSKNLSDMRVRAKLPTRRKYKKGSFRHCGGLLGYVPI